MQPVVAGIAYSVYADITPVPLWQASTPFGTPDFELPNDLNAIQAEAFAGIAATVVEIPAGCASIGDRAFSNCPNLTQIRIPARCTLGEDVFDGCPHVYVYGVTGSPAEIFCRQFGHCEFVEDNFD